MDTKIISCCNMCTFYKYEQIGDSELYGPVFSEFAACDKHLDADELDNTISNFDRTVLRDCCMIDFWKVLEVDSEIGAIFEEELSNGYSMLKSYNLFAKKYIRNDSL